MSPAAWGYFYSYMQSNLLEVLIFILVYRRAFKDGWVRGALVTTFSNAITHPLVFFGFMGSGWSFLSSIVAAEIFAIVAESGLHYYFGRLPLKSAVEAAIVANLVSWQAAPMLTFLVFF